MASGVVRVLCQILQEFKERWRLANEKPIGRQGLECSHCGPLCLGRANDRTYRELSAEERARLGHDQVSLKILPAEWRGVEVRKHQAISRIGQSRGIARLDPPGLQKKFYRTGQLPPGWQKKMQPFPYEIERRLPPIPDGCARGYMDGYAVVYEPRTRVIVDIHAVFGR